MTVDNKITSEQERQDKGGWENMWPWEAWWAS